MRAATSPLRESLVVGCIDHDLLPFEQLARTRRRARPQRAEECVGGVGQQLTARGPDDHGDPVADELL